MDNFKVLIVDNGGDGHEKLLEEFEVHNTDFETVRDISSVYIDNYFSGCYSYILYIHKWGK